MASNILKRRSALETLGASGHYRSCFITSYCFDFSFFEERILPHLRAAGVRNVNIVTDGPSLDATLEAGGAINRRVRSYGLNKHYATGAFHPKMLLFTGPTQGLLLVGSGNLTTSGMGSNDELWAAFHYNSAGICAHEGIFAAAFGYLSRFHQSVHGVNRENWERAIQFAPWLAGLQMPEEPFIPMEDGSAVAFLANTDEGNIFDKLEAFIPNRQLRQLTVVAPYYDANGAALKRLHDAFRPKAMRCIVETENSRLPLGLDADFQKKILFLDWAKCCGEGFKPGVNRLHAKAFHFQYEDGTEYLLLGSANATTAALGAAAGRAAVNEEACVLLRRSTKKDYLTELGIRIPAGKALLLKDLDSTSPPVSKGTPYKYRIVHAEAEGATLTVWLDKVPASNLFLLLLDEWGAVVYSIAVQAGEGKMVRLSLPEVQPASICLQEGGVPVSAPNILHYTATLLRNNPDPASEKLDRFFQQMEEGGLDEVAHLLQFVDYSWDDEAQAGEAGNANRTLKHAKGDTANTKTYERLSEEEFNAGHKDPITSDRVNNNPSVRIADFLSSLRLDERSRKDQSTEESAEARLTEAKPGEEDAIAASNGVDTDSQAARKAQSAIRRFFQQLQKGLWGDELSTFLDDPVITALPQAKHTIKRVSNLLVALGVVQLYCGKTFTESIPSDAGGNPDTNIRRSRATERQPANNGHNIAATETSHAVSRHYLPLGAGELGTLKGFLVHSLGTYLLQTTGGDEDYKYEPLNEKLKRSRRAAYFKAVFWVCNFPWTASEEPLKDTLLLNLTHYLAAPSLDELEDLRSELVLQLNECAARAHRRDTKHPFYVARFETELFPRYADWLRKYTDESTRPALVKEVSSLSPGDILFKRNLGFNAVRRIFKVASVCTASLERAGYDYHELDGAFMVEEVGGLGTKAIVFK